MSARLHTIYKGSKEIQAHEVPDEAGHVLVHYLHTGTYRTLRKLYSLQDSGSAAQFETRNPWLDLLNPKHYSISPGHPMFLTMYQSVRLDQSMCAQRLTLRTNIEDVGQS